MPQSSWATAADLPPELFRTILFHTNVETKAERHARLQRKSYRTLWKGLRACSLVCLYWANVCRHYLFHEQSITIRSRYGAQLFKKYNMKRNTRLVPLIALIESLNVLQLYKFPSFLHLLHFPEVWSKMARLELIGPIPPDFPLHALDTPHWSVPSTIVVPPSATAFKKVIFSDIDFRSFDDVIKLLKHFTEAESLKFRSLRWIRSDISTSLHIVHSKKMARRRILIDATDCTDNALVCMQAGRLYPRFLLRDKDILLVLGAFRTVYDYVATSPVVGNNKLMCSWLCDPLNVNRPQLQLAIGRDKYPEIEIDFICAPDPRLASSFTPVIGVLLYMKPQSFTLPEPAFAMFDLASFREQMQHTCLLRFFVIVFEELSILQSMIARQPALFHPFPGDGRYLLVCKRGGFIDFPKDIQEPEPWEEWMGVEPTAMTGTGETWKRIRNILPRLLSKR